MRPLRLFCKESRMQKGTAPTPSTVVKHTLANGVRVVVEPVDTVRSVAVGLLVDVGSRNEAPEVSGITHFIEHMVFKGTVRRKAHHIAQRLESVGGYLNAYTSKEHTCYYARGLDDHLERAIDVLSDMVTAPLFPEAEIEKEKDVVVEEIRMYADQPEDLIFDRTEAILHPAHALGRPILGDEPTVRSFSRETLHGYMRDQYVPERMVLAVAGNVQPQKVIRLAEKWLGGLERRDPVSKPDRAGTYVPTFYTETRPIQQAHLTVSTRTFDTYHPQRFAASLLNTLLSGGMSSLLTQHIRERYGYCYSVYSYLNLYTDTGDFGVYMATDPARVDHAKTLIFRELDALTQHCVTPRKLEQARKQAKGGLLIALESMSTRMQRLANQETYFGRIRSLEEEIELIESVSAEDIRVLAESLFRPENFSTVVLLPAT